MKTFKHFIVENDNNSNRLERNAENKFRFSLQTMHPDGVHIYHETPGHVQNSIKEKGLMCGKECPSTIYGTVGKPSEFVTQGKKTITHIVIPHSIAHHIITHDMRYSGYHDLMSQHPAVKGADVAIRVRNGKLPDEWIRSIKEVE